MSITLTALQKQRTDTAANWTSANPTLLSGELGFESDTGKVKLGNGSTAWTSLGYLGVIPSSGTYPLSQLIMPLGTAGAPPLTFVGDVNTGIYSPGADQVSFSAGGTERLRIDSTGQIEAVSLGTAAAPVITFTTDLNTGIYSPGADQLAISTNGTGRLFIDGSGSVGIGTSTPSTKFVVSNNGAAGLEIAPAGTGSAPTITSYNRSSSTYMQLTVDSSASIFSLLGVEKMRLDNVGLGIGTTTPTSNLSFGATDAVISADTSDASDNKSVSFTGGGAAATTRGGYIQVYGNEYTTTGGVVDINSGNVANSYVRIQGRSSTSDIRFWINASEAARIDSSGRLGIGTSSPDAKLEIVDTASSLTYPIAVSNFTDPAANVGAAVDFRLTTGGNSRGYIACQYTNNTAAGGTYLSFAPNDGSTGNIERMRITKTGAVGIGTTSPGTTLHLSASSPRFRLEDSDGGYAHIEADGGNLFLVSDNGASQANSFLALGVDGTERARIDSSGRLLVGTTSARGVGTSYSFPIENEGTGAAPAGISFVTNSNDAESSYLVLGKSRGTSIGANTIVQANDVIGRIAFAGADGTDLETRAAVIEAQIDGTPGSNDMPGRLVFSTTADGASSPTERMRIQNDGNVIIGKAGQTISYQNPGINLFSSGSADFTRASAYLISVNRKTDDGVLVEFYQDNNLEGTISVSGTTVSYNGAHLSRWSQLPSGTERTEILRGTVLSNIDEMCEWGDEENEQLNRMKVSDVEGDKNVSGVFQAWDDDDDTYTNDFYCAMTGDFIIRIASGVTVERGDLLMSAGDGTAKPQDDDIIRSKTIAKVTSTNVSCTYEDGSYCVPCVLMAC